MMINRERYAMKLRYLIITLIIFSIASIFIGVSYIHLNDLFSLTDQQMELIAIIRITSLIIIFSIASILIGVSDIHPKDLFSLTDQQMEVIAISRIPRLISILIAGASMSIAGLIMQQLSKNKFVSPTTAGTLDSARFGVLISLMLFTSSSPLLKITISFAFALLGTFIFMKILENIK